MRLPFSSTRVADSKMIVSYFEADLKKITGKTINNSKA